MGDSTRSNSGRQIREDPQSHQVPDRPSSRPAPEVDVWDRYFLLSLDGGGIRGLSILYILAELMDLCAHKELELDSRATSSFFPDEFLAPKAPSGAKCDDGSPPWRYLPCHYFDHMIGTSTGGLIAIMLGRLRMSVAACIEEYIALGEQIFGHPRRMHIRGSKRKGQFYPPKDKYKAGPLRDGMKRVILQRDPYLESNTSSTSDPTSVLQTPQRLCQTVVCAVRERTKQGFLFRSYPWNNNTDTLRARQELTHTKEIVDVAGATTAAPGYFKPWKMGDRRFFDGGLIPGGVNPCQYGMQEIEDFVGTVASVQGAVAGAISIGTGKISQLKDRKSRWYHFRYRESIEWEKKHITDPSQEHGHMLRIYRERMVTLGKEGQGRKFHYARYTVSQDSKASEDTFIVPENLQEDFRQMEGMKLDEWENGTAEKIERATKAYLQCPQVRARLKTSAEILVRRRRLKAQADVSQNDLNEELINRWYRYASASIWKCKLESCEYKGGCRKAIEDHLKEIHQSELVQGDNATAKREMCSLLVDGDRF